MLLALIVGLALAIEKTVSAIRHVIDPNGNLPTVVWNLVAFVVGIAVAVGWHHTIVPAVFAAVPALANSTALQGVSGEILSGAILGGLAGFGYGILQALEATVHRNRGSASPRSGTVL